MIKCVLCPRSCGADRDERSGSGFCQSGLLPRVARAAPHFGEEPCISGKRGSGAVFFCGCNLGCVFCQNISISRGGGTAVSAARLADIFLKLQDKGVHNINLVTGSHFVHEIARALEMAKLSVPVVWNSGGYDSVEALKCLEGLVQVYLPDMKYSMSGPAEKYSFAPDYPYVAARALKEMYRQTGPYELDGEGIMQKGMLIRHLVLPGELDNTFGVIDFVSEEIPPNSVMFSLMSQFTPVVHQDKYENLNRTLTREEYDRAESYLMLSGIEDGYFQGLTSADEEYIPAFDGTGVN